MPSQAYDTTWIPCPCRPSITFFSNMRRLSASIEFGIGSAATMIGLILGTGIVRHHSQTWYSSWWNDQFTFNSAGKEGVTFVAFCACALSITSLTLSGSNTSKGPSVFLRSIDVLTADFKSMALGTDASKLRMGDYECKQCYTFLPILVSNWSSGFPFHLRFVRSAGQ